jgi:hypothetical protein
LRIFIENFDEEFEDDMEWTFCKDANKDDKVEMEIVDIIKDLTNSVFINLNDNIFTKDDPHKRAQASSALSPLKTKEAMKELADTTKPTVVKNKKILLELKRLNANVFRSTAQLDDVSNCEIFIY